MREENESERKKRKRRSKRSRILSSDPSRITVKFSAAVFDSRRFVTESQWRKKTKNPSIRVHIRQLFSSRSFEIQNRAFSMIRARARNDSHTVIHDRAKVPRCSHSKKPYTRRGLGNRARACIPTRIMRGKNRGEKMVELKKFRNRG